MQELREELEDLSFVNLKPDVYATIAKRRPTSRPSPSGWSRASSAT